MTLLFCADGSHGLFVLDLCASDAELLTYASSFRDKTHLFFQPVDFQNPIFWKTPQLKNTDKCIVMHVPTGASVKGSDIIENVVQRLQAEGHALNTFLLIICLKPNFISY